MAKARGSKKGTPFEREICKRLSLWWTDHKTDDVFWRTSNSGGRATVRKRVGKRTEGQYGDVAATHEIGRPLIATLVIEIKRGYGRSSVHDLLDAADRAATQMYEGWFAKASEDAKAAGAYSWLLIAKRDRRKTLVFLPWHCCRALDLFHRISFKVSMVTLRCESCVVVGLPFDDFLSVVKKRHVLALKDAR